VTGAGRGIGRAITEALAGAGAEVLVHYNASESAAREVVDGITKSGGKAWSAGADLTKSANVHQLFETLAKRWDSLDILVNNAGDLIERRKVAEFSDDLLDRVMRLNFNSAIYVTRAAIPLLRRGENPSIINLSSVAAHNGGTNGASVYAASKGAIHTWTRGLARELAPEIRVNGIAPGVALTDFHRKHTSEDVLAQITASTALKRLGTAEDHGAAAVFLAGQGASFITGEIIEINGGLWLA
jgi:NAD(P)-dependent dehydrogenase (short-subunit alcohol dehydrogenase family)